MAIEGRLSHNPFTGFFPFDHQVFGCFELFRDKDVLGLVEVELTHDAIGFGGCFTPSL